MRLTITSDNIKLEIKPFVLQVEPLTFHADHEFKQKVVQMAADASMGQEEFLLQAVKFYITNLEQQ
ncbi:hypothetical protein ABH963_004051 [Bacillus sp. RC55]